ncbi:MAG: repeat protein [Pedosphaera sp.]|nr:repeat protein [Pedosphaera sp.]
MEAIDLPTAAPPLYSTGSVYGTTTFAMFYDGTRPIAIHVNELGLRDHLYLYVGTGDTAKMSSSYASLCPDTTPLFNTFDKTNSNLRNSFHWGPRQYPLLTAAFLSTLTNVSPSVNLSQLASADYLLARQRHWLLASDFLSLGQNLSLERAPSPDGAIQGQITWYDYDGKASGHPDAQGTMNLPSFEAWKLPNGDPRFFNYTRNVLGSPTVLVETYTDGTGSLQRRTTSLNYAANNIDLLTMVNAAGKQIFSNVFNAFHQVATNYYFTNPPTVFTYDGNQRLSKIVTPTGLTITNTYGLDGFLATNMVVGFSTNSFTWSHDLIATHTDARGLTTTATWDGLNRVVKVAFPDSTFVTNTYSKLDLVKVQDRLGYTNLFGYNALRQRFAWTNANGNVTTYDHCPCGLLNGVTDPELNTTSYTYDLNGRMIVAIYPGGGHVTNQYDLMGRLVKVSNNAGNNLTNYFNNQGLLTVASNSFGRVSTNVYDILDRATETINADGVSVDNTYDDLSRLLTRTYPDTGVEQFGYSVYGLIAYTNQLANVTTYAYDAALQLTNQIHVAVGLGTNFNTNTFTYWPGGEIHTLKDGNNQTTTWTYNQFGLLTNKTDAASNVIETNTYDANNRLVTRWTPAKGTTTNSYDYVGNLTNVTHPVSPAISYAYDKDNRMTTMITAGLFTNRFTYTGFGALQSEDGPWNDDTISYTYDNAMRRSGLNLQAPNADPWSQTYTYDPSGRMTNIASSIGSFGYSYDTTRRMEVANLSLPNGADIANTYDPVARLASTTLKNSTNGVLNSHSYLYDLGGERTNQTFTLGNYDNYTYDQIGQLLTANGFESNNTARLQEKLTNSFDRAGNLTRRKHNDGYVFYVANNLNQYVNIGGILGATMTVAGTTSSNATSVTVNGSAASLYNDSTFARAGVTLTSFGGGTNTFTAIATDSLGRHDTNTTSFIWNPSWSLFYDLNGNLTRDFVHTFDYDDENELIRVTVANAWKSEFSYDGALRMRVRKEFTWSGGAFVPTNEVHYVYDGKVVIQERDTNNLPLITYTRGQDLSGRLQRAGGIGGMLARTDHGSGQTAFYHADGNGNITAMINAQQFPVARYLYDPFGNILSLSGPLAEANLYRFSSKEYHPNSGLVCYLYRFYDPNLQRWINRDPIGESGGINLYNFVGNNPSCIIDPDGDDLAKRGGDLGTPCIMCHGVSANGYNGNLTSFSGLGTIPGGNVYSDAVAENCAYNLQDKGPEVMVEVLEQELSLLLIVILDVPEAPHVPEAPPFEPTPAPAPAPAPAPEIVFRGGSATADNLTPRPGKDPTGLSTFESIEAATPPGGKAQIIDTSKLGSLKPVPDAPPPGHVSITPKNPALLEPWTATRGTGQIHPLTQELIDAIIGEVKRPK